MTSPLTDFPSIHPYGDSAILINFSDHLSESINQQVLQLDKWLEANKIPGFLETIPAYTSLLVTYDPFQLSLQNAKEWLSTAIESSPKECFDSSKIINVPIIYGGTVGVDIGNVAKINEVTVQDVIQMHSQVVYTVAMMGFTPGFVYLSGLDERIATPRLSTPRVSVSAGAVGIAGVQTGIYSIESPGGWQLIGWTPWVLFDKNRDKPFMFEPGDKIRFIPQKANTNYA